MNKSNLTTRQREIADNIQMGLFQKAISAAVADCYGNAKECGWWNDLETGKLMTTEDRGIGNIFMLFVTEIAEGFEGNRKNKLDDHLPNYLNKDVEVADLFIRVCDYMGRRQEEDQFVDFGKIIADKLSYNMSRADHKVENRLKEDGKKL